MLERGKNERGVIEMVDTESLVPEGHLLRQVDRAVDFERLFKIVLLQYLDGNASSRGTLRRAETDVAYQWFLGYTLREELPHFSTVSYNFLHRFTPETIDAVFAWILEEAGKAGALTPAAVFIDGTHIKASANLNKKIKQEVPVAAKRYCDELLAEVNADREAHGKKPLDDEDEPPKSGGQKKDNTSKKKRARRKNEAKRQKTATVSTTDPDRGIFHKGEHNMRCTFYRGLAQVSNWVRLRP